MSGLEQEAALAEVKQKAYNLMQAHLASMRDIINDPQQAERLRTCGHKTLESFLKFDVLYVTKECDKLFAAFERRFP